MATIEKVTMQETHVSKLEATTIEQDSETGEWLREIRVYGAPITEGGSSPLIFTLVARGLNKEDLQILTPPFEF